MDEQSSVGVLRHRDQRPVRPRPPDPAGLRRQVEPVRDRTLLRPADRGRRVPGAAGHGVRLPRHQLLRSRPGDRLGGHAQGSDVHLQPGERGGGPLHLRGHRAQGAPHRRPGVVDRSRRLRPAEA
ncbi:hypothetical protein G6F58_013016 [Rhizopus delemar]|nr:hypothetical protein G6F58_013016 [Rhizopus delemar]